MSRSGLTVNTGLQEESLHAAAIKPTPTHKDGGLTFSR